MKLRDWFVGVAICASASMLSATESSLTVGVASAEITPPKELLKQEILDPLHGRALVLELGGTRVVLFTLDTNKVGDAEAEVFRGAIAKAVGVPVDHVLVNASHSNRAPRLDPRGMEQAELAKWKEELPSHAARLAREADAARRPATLGIGRANIGEWLFNWRMILPDGSVRQGVTMEDSATLPDGLRPGPVDPTVTVLQMSEPQGGTIASIFHLACHAYTGRGKEGVSADFPGIAAAEMKRQLGGEVLFLQGCAGDITSVRQAVRGTDKAGNMGRTIADRAIAALKQRHTVNVDTLHVSTALIGLPATPTAIAQTGKRIIPAEVQVITLGDLAIVALPGEPFTRISAAIQKASAFPHTIVLGYSNGIAGDYVGAPDEPHGTSATALRLGVPPLVEHEAGGFMIATASRLLKQHHDRRLAPARALSEKPVTAIVPAGR